jgi:hypothetical protein
MKNPSSFMIKPKRSLPMSVETLSLVAGTILSLAFSYVPGLHARFASLDATHKRLILLGILLAASAAIYGLACSTWGAAWGIALTCDQRGLAQLFELTVLAVIANQGIYQITPRS